MSERLFEVDYDEENGYTFKIHPKKFKLLPEETREHLRAANKEALLALKALIESAVSVSDQAKEKTKPRKIKVQ